MKRFLRWLWTRRDPSVSASWLRNWTLRDGQPK